MKKYKKVYADDSDGNRCVGDYYSVHLNRLRNAVIKRYGENYVSKLKWGKNYGKERLYFFYSDEIDWKKIINDDLKVPPCTPSISPTSK